MQNTGSLDVSVLKLGQIRFFVAVFVSALLMNVLSCRGAVVMHLSMLSPRGGGTPGICGAFDFSEEFLVKIPTVGPQNLVKSDQISPP